METIYIYLLKASGLIALFYLAYYFLLRKETFFTANRFFLLAGLGTAVVLPLFYITKIVWVNPTPLTFPISELPLQHPFYHCQKSRRERICVAQRFWKYASILPCC